MSAVEVAMAASARQGWSDGTLLDLCLTYIDRQADTPAFADYLAQVAAQEST